MVDLVLVALFGLVWVVAYIFGWTAGRSSGKVDALESAHDIDLSGGDD